MKPVRLLALVSLISIGAVPVGHGADHIWIVGGGPSPDASQASIELNVKWLREVIGQRARDAAVTVYYTQGNERTRDVLVWEHPRETAAALQPLARVFDAQVVNGNRYYSHTVPGVAAGTRAPELAARLKQEFSRLVPGDRALFIYNGHGSYEEADVSKNALRLWDKTLLSARELEGLLSEINPAVPVRAFLPQCFSGGFSRIVHPGARDVRELVAHNRCGFMSVPADRESEGCTPGIDSGDYRDYTTYFFAALAGRTRTGQPLAVNPDRDADKSVSLREAHFYSLVHADSTDMPRSTSEIYLEKWQPWYLRWLVYRRDPDNIYSRLAAELATRLSLPATGAELIQAIDQRRETALATNSRLKQDKKDLKKSVKELQEGIRAAFAVRWPEASHPYTAGYSRFLANDLAAAQQYILGHPKYGELVRQQERDLALDAAILASDRELAQLDRILRLRRLARILDSFERTASGEDRAAYQKLVSCEATGL